MKLIIIRGPSGSGKSTIAQHLGGEPKVNWFESDDFFSKNGNYQFDPRKLGQAHVWCRTKAIEALMDKNSSHEFVIVSNTSTTLTEVNTYIDVAKKCGAEYEVIRTPGPWIPSELFLRNKHNVPLEVLKKQIMRYIPVDGETEWSDLSIFKNGVNGK